MKFLVVRRAIKYVFTVKTTEKSRLVADLAKEFISLRL